MFAWEDQEIANIIWGEADENIVPFPVGSKKKSQSVFVGHDNSEVNKEAVHSKPSEQKPAATKTKLHGVKMESNDDLPLLASNSDLNCLDSLTGKKTDPEKGPETSEDQNGDRELRDIIGNSWINIESFNDLDQIFSNDELVDHANLDSTDEMWTSSRDVIDSVVNSSSLTLDTRSWGLEASGNSADGFDFNNEYLHNENQLYATRYEKSADATCYTQERLPSRFDRTDINVTAGQKLIPEETALGMTGRTLSKPETAARKLPSTNKSTNKGNWRRSRSKPELKSDKINNLRQSRDIYGSCPTSAINFQQFDSRSLPETPKNYVPSVLGQQNTPQQSTCLPYQQISNPYFATYSYGKLSDQCTVMSVLPAADDERQPVLSNVKSCLSEEVSLGKSTDTPLKPQNMTPQEKIEKLRRRQQMRAMLAIQKQQQQLNHSVPIADSFIGQKSSEEDRILSLERADFEAEESIIPTYDPNSLTLDGPSAISVEAEDQNVEDTVLYPLQDVVSKLDMKIRTCIRDSLFRLAQSAIQRHYASDSGTGNRSAGCKPNIKKEEISNQERMPGAENETNYIDRVVAQLLFRQPFESSVKHNGNRESFISPKIPPDLEMDASSSLSFVSMSSGNEQNISTHASKPRQEELSEQPQTDVSVNEKMKQKMVESSID